MLFWTVLLSFMTCVVPQSNTDVQGLLTSLFTTNSYNKLVRPTATLSTPTNIFIEMVLYSLNSVDEVEQKLTTVAYLDITWVDELLTWTPASHNGIDYIHVPQENIWKPDIALQNGFKDLKGLGSDFIRVFIDSSGAVLWYPFHAFESKCAIDATYFPFEKQTCNIDFVAWSLGASDVNMAVGNDGIDMEQGKDSNSQWNIISSSSTSFSESGESKVRFSIVIQRKPLFYIMNIILPIILLSVLNNFTFKIPADNGERMGYTITTWLAFAVFLTMVSSTLPQSSDTIPILSIYIMIQLFLGTGTVMLSSWESRAVVRSDNENIPSIWKRYTLFTRKKCCVKKTSTITVESCKPNEKDGVSKETTTNEVDWKECISALDMACFWILTVFLLISTATLLMLTGLRNA